MVLFGVMNDVFDGYMKVLGQTEWAHADDLDRYRQGLLANLVRHAHRDVAFYRPRLECLFDAAGHLDLSHWQDVPLLTRADVASHAAAMRPARLAEVHGPIVETETSGSSGRPLSIASNQLVNVAGNAAITRMARWWNVDVSRPLARIRAARHDPAAFPEGRHGRGWSLAAPEADAHDLDLRTPVEQQLDWLVRQRSPYLLTAPSNATALAYAASPEMARALDIGLVFTVGETVLPYMREVVAERLGAEMAAIYSCEEIGVVATQCPRSDGYHVVVENALVEILRDDGSPAPPGEVGQIALTGFYNYAMPFIRYVVGDVAIAADGPCACGRSLPVIAQVLGRTRCAMIFEDGTRVWPRNRVSRALKGFVPHRQFQLVQVDHRRIELRYVPDDSGRPADVAGLSAYLREALHPSVEVTLAPMPVLPPGVGGKIDPFVSLIAQ